MAAAGGGLISFDVHALLLLLPRRSLATSGIYREKDRGSESARRGTGWHSRVEVEQRP